MVDYRDYLIAQGMVPRPTAVPAPVPGYGAQGRTQAANPVQTALVAQAMARLAAAQRAKQIAQVRQAPAQPPTRSGYVSPIANAIAAGMPGPSQTIPQPVVQQAPPPVQQPQTNNASPMAVPVTPEQAAVGQAVIDAKKAALLAQTVQTGRSQPAAPDPRVLAAQRVATGLAQGPELGGPGYGQPVDPMRAEMIAKQMVADAAQRKMAEAQAAGMPGSPDDPVAGAIVDAVQHPGEAIDTAAAKAFEYGIQKPIEAATDLPLIGKTIGKAVHATQVPYEASVNYAGEQMYQIANGGDGPGLTDSPYAGIWKANDVGAWYDDQGNVVRVRQYDQPTMGPDNQFYYDGKRVHHEGAFTHWAKDPANKQAIDYAYTQGLDLNGDGTIDVKGGAAVFAYYNAATSKDDGFIATMVKQLGMDPLFYAGVGLDIGLPAATRGAEAAAEGAAVSGATMRAAILNAVAKGLRGAELANEGAKKAMEAPIKLPLLGIELAAKGIGAIPRVGTTVRRGIGWLGEPADSTVRTNTVNAAENAARAEARAGDIPVYRTDIGDTPTEATTDIGGPTTPRTDDEFRDVGAGEEPVTVAPKPKDATPTEPVRTEPQPTDAAQVEPQPTVPVENVRVTGSEKTGFRVSQRTGKSWKTVSESYPTKAEAETAKQRYIDTVSTKPPEKPLATEATTEPALAGPPEKPLLEEPADPRVGKLLTQGTTQEERNALIKEGRITSLSPVLDGPKLADRLYTAAFRGEPGAFERWDAFAKEYTPKAEAYAARPDPYVPDFELKQARQIVDGIEHTVKDVAPSYVKATGEFPDIPVVDRNRVNTRSGKASFTDENLGALLQKYVFTESDAEAARIATVLTSPGKSGKFSHPEFGGKGWTDALMTRLKELREDLKRQRAAFAPQEFKADLGIPPEVGVPASSHPRDVIPAVQELQQAIADKVEGPPPGTVGFISPESRMLMQATDAIEQRLDPSFARDYAAPDFAPGGQGLTDRFTTPSTTPQMQAARGDISPETAAWLDEPITVYEAKIDPETGNRSKAGTWQAIEKRDFARATEKQKPVKQGATTEFKSGTIRARQTTRYDLYREIVDATPDLSETARADLLAQRVADVTGKVPTPAQKLSPGIRHLYETGRAIGRLGGELNHIGASALIHNVATGAHGFVNDFTGDTARMALGGHFDAALTTASGIEHMKIVTGMKTEAMNLADEYGMPLPVELLEPHQRSEVAGSQLGGPTPMAKALNKLSFGKLGRAADILTEPFDSRIVRRARQINDLVGRQSIFVSEIRKLEGRAGREFRRRMRSTAEKNGVPVWAVDEYLKPLGERYSPQAARETMTKLARDFGLDEAEAFGSHAGAEWQRQVSTMWNAANKEQRRVLFSYDRTNADNFLGKFFLYHYWMSRAIPAYARIALRNPWVAAMWVRAVKDMDRRFEAGNYPDTLKGFIKFAGSYNGYSFAWNPMSVILPLVDMLPQGTSEQDQTLYEQISQYVVTTPTLRIAAGILGQTDMLTDPLATNAVRKFVLAAINEVRAHNGQGPVTDPYEATLHKAFTFLNRIAAHLPGVDVKQFYDPRTTTQSIIQYNIATVIEQQTGKPVEQWGQPEWDLYEDAVHDGELDIPNPIYQLAFQQYADATWKGVKYAAVSPSNVRVRYGPRDEFIGTPYEELTPAQQTAKGLLNAGGSVDIHLQRKKDEYKNLGTPEQKLLADGWRQLAYGPDNPERWAGVMIGSSYISWQEYDAMTPDQKRDLADAWVASQGGTEELKAYRDEQDKFVAENPEFGDLDQWTSNAYKFEGGTRAFRLNRAAGNPNFKAAMERQRDQLQSRGITGEPLEMELDKWAAGLGGYEAAHGIKASVYDPAPGRTGDQATVDAILKSGIGGGSGGSSGGGKKSTADKLAADLAKYETDLAVVKGLLPQYGIDPSVIYSRNPIALHLMGSLFGPLMPSPTSLMQKYQDWASLQPKGADTSPAAFGAFVDGLAAKAAVAKYDPKAAYRMGLGL